MSLWWRRLGLNVLLFGARRIPSTQRQWDGIVALVVLWLMFAVPASVVGLFRGDAGQGFQRGTLAYGLLIASLVLYGCWTRRVR